jgi:glycyl-tRNA synthetase
MSTDKENTNNMDSESNVMEKIISLAKRRGFIFQGSEIYGGLAGTWDYGPLGVALKRNIEGLWWKRFVTDREDMYGMDAAILMNQDVWKATGHVATFADPLVEDLKTKKRYRVDHILLANNIDLKGMKVADMDKALKENNIKSPEGNPLGDARQFNLMLKTHMGAIEDDSSISYLRPETAQGMFVNFKNVIDSFHPKLPFGMAQIGKAFRNEIAPRDFIFRVREFEQMEIEYFVKPENWEGAFEEFRAEMLSFTEDIGLPRNMVHELEIAPEDRAHYSERTIDFEFDYPFGRKELYGLAYRTDFDLKSHSESSKVDLSYFEEETKERFLAHCIEPSFGVGRSLLAVLTSAYTEDELGGETRCYLKLSPKVAPTLVAVFPLLKNKPQLVEKAREVYMSLRKEFGRVAFDDNGNIGKRYRRQDEIGTPFCVTIDFDTVEKDNMVTVRDRDTGEQERVAITDLKQYLHTKI